MPLLHQPWRDLDLEDIAFNRRKEKKRNEELAIWILRRKASRSGDMKENSSGDKVADVRCPTAAGSCCAVCLSLIAAPSVAGLANRAPAAANPATAVLETEQQTDATRSGQRAANPSGLILITYSRIRVSSFLSGHVCLTTRVAFCQLKAVCFDGKSTNS